MTTPMPELLPCPFCGDTPWFEGDADDWQDDHRYVKLELNCCTSMSEAIGWKQARDMTAQERTTDLKARLTNKWNTRAAIESTPQPDPYITELIDRLRDKTDIIPDMTVRQANAHLVGLCDDAADALEAAHGIKGLT